MQQIDHSGKVYEKEQEEPLTCPVCGKPVDYLLGDDEGGNQPDRGRRGCEDCWRPFKYHQQGHWAPQPDNPLDPISGTTTPSPASAGELLDELVKG